MRDLMTIIRERHSSRGLFDGGRRVPREHLLRIVEAMRWAPTAHNMQNFEVVLVDDADLLRRIAELRREVSAAFLEENFEQLSFSEEELQARGVGLLATMFPPSWRKRDARPEGPPEPLGEPVRTSAALLVVIYEPTRRAPASEGDFLGIMSLGCVLENMWLMAESLGVGFHVMSSLGQGSVEREVKRMLGVPEALRIAFAARLGYPVTPSQRPRVRRDVRGFAHKNRFGQREL